MKKLLALCLLALCLCACGTVNNGEEFTVVATLFPQYDFAKNIVGDSAKVELLLDYGTDAHSYDPTPADIMKIARADLFIYTGDGMELWAKTLLGSADIKKAIDSGSLTVLDLSHHVELISPDGHVHDESHDHEHAEADPHIWTSPENALKMCEAIADALCTLDDANSESYIANLGAYSEKLRELDTYLTQTLASARLNEVYFGGSFAFTYLFAEGGISHISVYEGCASHAEPTAADIARVTDAIRAAGAKYIIYDTATEEKTARIIANESGASLLRMHAIHNISKAEVEGGEDFVSLTRANIETLGKALN